MFSRPKILFLVSLLFVALLNPKLNPYLLFKFLIFYHSSLFYHIYLFFCVGFTISANFIEFLRKVCVYDETFGKVLAMLGKELFNLKGSTLGQILRADKTGFCRLGHIFVL